MSSSARPSFKVRLTRLLVSGLLLTGGCVSSDAPRFEPFDPSARPPAADYPGSPAVILLDRGELRFGYAPESGRVWARLRRWRRLQLIREQVSDLRSVDVPEAPTTRIRDFRVRLTDDDGRRIVLSDAQRRTDPSGLPILRIALPKLVPGSVIESIYDTWFEDPRFVPPWRFDAEWPTERSEFAAVVPAGVDVELRFSRDGAYVDEPPDRFETEDGVRFAWSHSRIPPRWPETDSPAPELLAPRAHVHFLGAGVGPERQRGFSTWEDVATWLVGRVPGWETLDEATRAEATRVAGTGSDLERALALFDVVATQLEPESEPASPLWRAPLPHPTKVLAAGRANPSSRGLLLASLLRSLELPADLVMYADRDRDVLLPDLPSVRSLDGVAVALSGPKGTVFLDPTTLNADPNVPPPRLQGRRVVVLDESGVRIVRVPESLPNASRVDVQYVLEVRPGGALVGELSGRLTGAEAARLREDLRAVAPERYAEAIGNFLSQRGASLPPVAVRLTGLRSLGEPLELHGTLELSGELEPSSERMYLPLGRFVGAPPPVVSEVRRSPRRLGPPREASVTVELRLPRGWSVASPPPPFREVSGAGLWVQLGAQSAPGEPLLITFARRQNTSEISRRDHAELRSFQLAWKALAARTVAFVPPDDEDLPF